MDFLPGVPISHSPPAIVVGKDVIGVEASPLTDERFSTVELKCLIWQPNAGGRRHRRRPPAPLRTRSRPPCSGSSSDACSS